MSAADLLPADKENLALPDLFEKLKRGKGLLRLVFESVVHFVDGKRQSDRRRGSK